ncbi:hypothetical protein AB0D12_39065 [Streptomyces sp. NPDC048479]|uniref:hypothetical protein n=1 Tax=Streptomyces sp. NPDC048479 TaxID=3154725 RepID=UPI00341F03CA
MQIPVHPRPVPGPDRPVEEETLAFFRAFLLVVLVLFVILVVLSFVRHWQRPDDT